MLLALFLFIVLILDVFLNEAKINKAIIAFVVSLFKGKN
jgi:hypothetical protein